MTTVGIIGAGQLGQMLGYAGKRLGLEFIFLDPADDPPARFAGPVLRYPFDSEEGLHKLSAAADLVTYEFENVPVAAVEILEPDIPVYPPAAALSRAQDRLAEKTLFQSLDIPVPAFRTVDSVDDLRTAAQDIGLPLVLKTRRFGYDGKGQFVLREESRVEEAVEILGGRNLIAEQWVPFEREVSAIGCRNVSGEIATYPLTENEHVDGILSVSRAPADDGELARLANEYLGRLLSHLEYVGILALELFVADGRLLANEFAPRVHNSGHWTIEGAETSQFENHLRAILDLQPGPTGMRGYAGMLNLIGTMPADRAPFESPPCHLHDYGKEPRPGRKLGHATVVTAEAAERDRLLLQLSKHLNR